MTNSDNEALMQATGERFIPELMGGELIEAEHEARYRLALPHVAGKRVLDAGCGVGWGAKLLQAEASSVVGVDLSEEAIADCRSRAPGIEFLVGDLQDLPVADADFDVVVCFEALEHTADTDATLNELARALRPDGILFVSSPNPRVYPAGNPFHIHEMVPEELADAVSARFMNVVMFRQHLQLSSLLAPESSHGSTDVETSSHLVTPLAPGHDAYSVAVASNAALPRVVAVQCMAPSDQLDNLGALAGALAEERETMHSDYARIAEERTRLFETLEQGGRERELIAAAAADAEQRLVVAGEQLGMLMSERDSAITEVRDIQLALTEAQERVRDIGVERDRFARNLIEAEQQNFLPRSGYGSSSDPTTQELRRRIDELADRAIQRELDLHTIQQTFSWRVTAPLRRVRARQRRLAR